MFVYSAQAGCVQAGCPPLFFVENQRLEYVLQHFSSSMRFYNESVFTEIFLKRIKEKQRGKDSFHPCGQGLSLLFIDFGYFALWCNVNKRMNDIISYPLRC